MELRAVIALALGYGAFEAEIFRAGIQSISKGQMEAARSLGMSYIQSMRFVILPQAIRRVLPPLGNDFIAMLKDSSLATVLAVNELTQLTRIRRSSTFRVMEAFNVAAFLYLAMTLLLSAAVRVLERKMKIEE
jgi:polar amino acid transport system permease protein